jgi:hypothetical protein
MNIHVKDYKESGDVSTEYATHLNKELKKEVKK